MYKLFFVKSVKGVPYWGGGGGVTESGTKSHFFLLLFYCSPKISYKNDNSMSQINAHIVLNAIPPCYALIISILILMQVYNALLPQQLIWGIICKCKCKSSKISVSCSWGVRSWPNYSQCNPFLFELWTLLFWLYPWT